MEKITQFTEHPYAVLHGEEVEKRDSKGESWSFDYLVNVGFLTLTNCNSKLGLLAVFAPRVITWEFLGTEFSSEPKEPNVWKLEWERGTSHDGCALGCLKKTRKQKN